MVEFYSLAGRKKKINPIKYKIDWIDQGRSKFQQRVKHFLYTYWKDEFICEEFPLVGCKQTFDIFHIRKKIAIEVQGQQHTKYIPFFHGEHKNNFLNQLKRDQDKVKYCQINGILLVEVFPEDEPLTKDFFTNHGIAL